jgi:hypothetical protein
MAKEAYKHVVNMDFEQAGAWLTAKSQALDAASGQSWKKGVEQFKSGKYRPGLGNYEWKEGEETPPKSQ